MGHIKVVITSHNMTVACRRIGIAWTVDVVAIFMTRVGTGYRTTDV